MLQSKAVKPYLKPKKVLGYMFMPRVIPRIKELFGHGFSWVAMLMALIYQSVRLLPIGHPYTNPANKGRFGIRNVIMEAAYNLKFKKENIDQIIVFLIILLGFLLLVFQIIMLLAHLLIAPAFAVGAGIPGFAGLFATPNPTNDIAFMLLDQVFGIPDLYNSKFAPTGAGAIPPFQQGLQTLFQYYSMMILIVAVFVLLYYIVVTLGETVTTGVPFGRRFNTIYAPLRLVIAIGLIVPINYGLNSAQYITLFSAKWGSGLATNGWILFANNVANPTDLQDEALLARPNIPNPNHIVKFMMIVQACRFAYETIYADDNSLGPNIGTSGGHSEGIQPYYVRNWPDDPTSQLISLPADWQEAIDFFGGDDITIRFGHHDPEEYRLDKGNVRPYCGEITVHVTSHDGEDGVTTGAEEVQQQYLRMITYLWQSAGMQDFGQRAMGAFLPVAGLDPCAITFTEESSCDDETARFPPEEFKQTWFTNAQNLFYVQVAAAYGNSTNGTYAPAYAIPQDLLDRGWGGAAIWYNHIAEWNGAFTAAVLNLPTPSKMPSVMEKVEETRRTNDQIVDPANRFNPNLSDGQTVDFTLGGEWTIAKMLDDVFKYWESGDNGEMTDTQPTGNVIISALTAIFGLNGLFDMRSNPDTHPLAALVAAGKAIIDSAIRNLMVGLIGNTAGGMFSAMQSSMGGFITAASSMFVSFATIGITVGFILYYILPFIPFMYFFFAVGTWVKSIFEALVGVPLWALAHLRVDGNGIPGDSASAGYFLIFEIFLRPILTVFGLLGGMAIFSAMMRVMHDIFPLVTANLTGFDASVDTAKATLVPGIEYKRDIIDEFMFTIVYTIVAYMVATSSFKMIDQVPNSILRWMGAGVQSFSDNNESAVQGLVQYAGIGGYSMAGQMTGAMEAGAQGTGAVLGTAGRGLTGLMGRGGNLGGGP